MDHVKDSVATARAHPRTNQKPTWVVAPSNMVSETVVAAETSPPPGQKILGREKENSHATEKYH